MIKVFDKNHLQFCVLVLKFVTPPPKKSHRFSVF